MSPGIQLWLRLVVAGAALFLGARARAAENPTAEHFRSSVQPILAKYCYDCHADGANKGGVAFDELKTAESLVAKPALWSSVMKNLRAGLMPPERKPRPSAEELKTLENWVKYEAFGIDPANPDPGRVTIRRLNRVEYKNTIRDLTGHDFKVEDELPPDDTGYGFDNIGDVLTISPLLLEKYMQAAEKIVAEAVPRVPRMMTEKVIPGSAFRAEGPNVKKERYSFYEEANASHTFTVSQSGDYKVDLELEVAGQFDFDPGRCSVVLRIDGREAAQTEFGWQNGKRFHQVVERSWEPGERNFTVEIHPLVPPEKKKNALDLKIVSLRVQGPTAPEKWGRPKNFELFFSRDVPESPEARRDYAREILRRFSGRAFRRPVDERSLARLAAIAEAAYGAPGQRFEDGIAQAMIPVLASPRFLFRVEEPAAGGDPKRHPFVDDHALASRLSYFLWSTMPDEELFRLAERRELRANLGPQVKRMLADSRSQALVENFTGQWLQARDVEGIDINPFAVLARDKVDDPNIRKLDKRFESLRDKKSPTPEEEKELEQLREERRKRFRNRPVIDLDRDLRKAMRLETEMCFAHILKGDRSLLELLDSDYTFLNERLAKHYGLTNLVAKGFSGAEMRRVSLPAGDVRGGVLAHGSVLIVTSNPTRTSPVKRGLFVLDNILGIPPPPPPPDVPNLEESEKGFKDRQPTLRETLEIHRAKPLCSSCHNRMDPLGLALENFNALGLWRESERGQSIDASGKLITGEPFKDIRELKKILVANHASDFYRCLTEKLLTYALGRGLEYYDVQTVDQIVERLEKENGRFSVLLQGVVESAPFLKSRAPGTPAEPGNGKPLAKSAENL